VADYLSDEEQLDRLRRWWDENGTSFVVSVLLALTGIVGWRWYDSAQLEKTQMASDAYESYVAATTQAERTELAAQIDAEFGDSSYATFVRLRQAKDALDTGDVDDAINLLRAVVEGDSHVLLTDLARVRWARRLQQQDDSEAGLAALAQVRSKGLRAHVLDLKGDIHLARGERALAHEAYSSAADELGEDDRWPILDMKVDDTAPPNDQQ